MDEPKSGELIPFQDRPKSKQERWAAHWHQALKNIAEGSSLREECAKAGVDVSTAYMWIMAHPEREKQYNLAYVIVAEGIADSVAKIAGKLVQDARYMTPAEVQAYRVAMDGLMWSAAIRNNRKYGEKRTVEIEAVIDPKAARAQLEQLRKELAPLFAVPGGKSAA